MKEQLRFLPAVAIGLAVLALLAFIDDWTLRRLVGRGYLAWYLSHGTIIALVTALATQAWDDLERNEGLISPHPLLYLGACVSLITVSLASVAAVFPGAPKTVKTPYDPLDSVVAVLFLV